MRRCSKSSRARSPGSSVAQLRKDFNVGPRDYAPLERPPCATTPWRVMGYPLQLSLRYMNSKKGAFISVGTAFAIVGVALGVAALATVMSVTGGFQKEFREKVLGVNAHVLVLKYSTDFREYRDTMEKVSKVPGVIGRARSSSIR